MAMQKRAKAPSFTTPRGVFKYPKISELDFGNKEFPAPDGKYQVELILKAADQATQDFIALLQPLHEQAMQAAGETFKALKAETRKKLGKVTENALYTELLDQDTEEPTGELSFKFSIKASGEYKKDGNPTGRFWDTRPAVFDAKGGVLVQGFRFRDREADESIRDVHVKVKPDIWGGTVGKVSFDVGIDRRTGVPGYFIPGNGAAGLKLELKAVQVIDLVSGGQRTAKDHGFGDESGEEDDREIPATADTGADF